MASTSSVKTNSQQKATSIKSQVKEDEIDEFLAKLDGRIERKRNPTMYEQYFSLFTVG